MKRKRARLAHSNERVLQEAMDKTVPLIERVPFLGIFSLQSDEFFKVMGV